MLMHALILRVHLEYLIVHVRVSSLILAFLFRVLDYLLPVVRLIMRELCVFRRGHAHLEIVMWCTSRLAPPLVPAASVSELLSCVRISRCHERLVPMGAMRLLVGWCANMFIEESAVGTAPSRHALTLVFIGIGVHIPVGLTACGGSELFVSWVGMSILILVIERLVVAI